MTGEKEKQFENEACSTQQPHHIEDAERRIRMNPAEYHLGNSVADIAGESPNLTKDERYSLRLIAKRLDHITAAIVEKDQVIARLSDLLAEALDAVREVQNWAKAYPVESFPEPDWKDVREALAEHGITLDAVSASNMRHVLTGVLRIVNEALKGESE